MHRSIDLLRTQLEKSFRNHLPYREMAKREVDDSVFHPAILSGQVSDKDALGCVYFSIDPHFLLKIVTIHI